jgi:hypothetical protein
MVAHALACPAVVGSCKQQVRIEDNVMGFWKLAAPILAIACGAAAQGLAPETLLLAHIRSHMRDELSRVTN